MKAGVDITIAKGDPKQSVTITFTSSASKFEAPTADYVGSYPVIQGYNNDGTKYLTVTPGSAVYKIPYSENEDGTTVSLTTSSTNTDWGNITITVDGKVTSFLTTDAGVAEVAKQITGITFTNNGELSALKLGKDQHRINYFPNLTTLNVSGNKLKYIPPKEDTDDEGKKISISTSYIIGKQTPDVTFQGTAGNARSGVRLDATALNFEGTKNPLRNATDLQIATLYKDGTAVNYAVADENYANTKKYTFKDGNIYVDGNFTADIQVNDAKYKGAIICGVPVTVEAAKFKVVKADGGAYGALDLGNVEVNVTELTKGDAITVTPEPKEGYKLNGEPKTVGLTKTGNDNDVYYYTVTGDKDIEISASFTADGTTLKYTAPANATITVERANGTEVRNGETITVGEKLTVIVKPNTGYTVSLVKNGDADITANNISKDPGIFKAEVTVGADGVNITAEVKAAESTLTIVYKNADGLWEGADLINKTTGEKVGEPSVSGNIITYSKVAFGTPLNIILTLKEDANAIIKSVTINSSPREPRKQADNKYIIENYYMLEVDTRVIVEVASSTDITITPTMEKDADDGNKYYVTYDGQPNPVTYTVTPNNMQGVKVQYARDEKGAQPQDNAYTDCGNYVAYFSYDADETHQIASGSEKVEYKIAPAQVIITDEPKVTINEDNQYVINGGKAAYMRDGQPIDITELGEFVLAEGYTTYNEGEKDAKVIFKPNDTKNLKEANATIILELEGVKKYTVKIDPSSKDILTMWNKNAKIEDGATVLEGTAIRFEIEKEEGLTDDNYNVYQIDGSGNIISSDFYNKSTDNGVIIGTDTRTDGDATTIIFRADVTKDRPTISLGATCDTEEERTQTVTYDGSVQAYDPLKLVLLDPDTKNPIPNGQDQAWTWTVSYSLNGQTVAEPTDAGEYTVTLNRKATGHYQAFSTTATLVIDKADLKEAGITVPSPTASRVNVGMPLYRSSLTGSADIAGYYDWGVDNSQEVTLSNNRFPVIFYPSNDNYKPMTLKETVTVPVTDEAIIVYWSDGNGYLTVKDASGKEYYSGDAVKEGTILTFTAVPYDNTKFEFESLVIDDYSYSNGASYQFGKGSIEAYCSFKAKTTEIPVYEGQYAVELPEAVRGAKISYSGEPIVERGDDFTFTVTTLAADASKLRVTAVSESGASQTLTRAANGSYTIRNITEKQEVRITLSNPTEVKVNIPLVYHEKGEPTSGRVQIINNTSSDGKYYYNDELTLIAYPETGVEFYSWSDKNRDSVRDLVLDKAEVSLEAIFTGTPVTGIEDIESATVYTGKGFIMVKNVANAEITVVSISGRLQAKQEISGDTRIDVPQGIYVVVLQSGDDVKRVKVIVK